MTDPTALASLIDRTARDLLAPEVDGTRYRLLGIGLSDLVDGVEADPPDLIEPKREKEKAAAEAMERVRARFGTAAIVSGKSLRDA